MARRSPSSELFRIRPTPLAEGPTGRNARQIHRSAKKIHIHFSRFLASAAKTVRSAPSIPSAFRTLTVLTVGIVSVAFFFRYQIANGFTWLAGDRYDGFIELSILEHWYNVAQGFSHWSQMNYFYPVAGSLGYNDGYFFYGLIYAVFRWSGTD